MSTGMGSPRTRSVDGGALPSPRLVSNIVFTQKDNNEDRKLTLLVMSWGQFTEHDVLFTPADTCKCLSSIDATYVVS